MVDSAPAPSPAIPPPVSGISQAQVLDQQRAPQRAAALAGLQAIRSGAETQAAAAIPPSTQATATATATTADAVPDPSAAATPAVDPVAVETPPAPPVDVEPPGMAAVRKAEQHNRQKLAQERASMLQEMQQQQLAWQQKLEAASALEAKIANARQDPLAAMEALGFGEADFEHVGRLLYGASPEGRKDPKHAAAGRAGMEKRAQETQLEKLQRKIDELDQKQALGVKQAEERQNVENYLGSVTKSVGDNTPLARSALAKNPERTRNTLLAIADQLFVQSGPSLELREVPTPAQVLAAYEQMRTAELEELGIDPKTIGRAPAAPPVVPPVVAPTPVPAPAVTAAPIAAVPTPVPAPAATPTREEVLAEIAKMRRVG